MKALFINHSDSLGGASTVTLRLVQALRECGVDARMLVVGRTTRFPYVAQAAPWWRSRMPFLAEHLRIFVRNGFSRADLFKASIATDGLPLSRHPWVRGADVVVLNWVNQGMLSLREIGRIAASRPTVWTMHDMWNFTGLCHHAATCDRFTAGCGCCPLLHSAAGPNDLSAGTFVRKQELYSAVPIHFVAVSGWLARRAAGSPLLSGCPVSVIHNTFEPVGPISLSRSDLGLPDDGRPIITICAARLDDPVKGLPIAIDALNSLSTLSPVAVLVGEIRDPRAVASLAVPYVSLGPVADRARLQAIFSRSSVVMSSSLYESFGATLLEAQLAGTTPVAFTHDGRADIIDDTLTGYSATFTPSDRVASSRSLAAALRRALEAPIDPGVLRTAAMRFSPTAVADRYRSLFCRLT